MTRYIAMLVLIITLAVNAGCKAQVGNAVQPTVAGDKPVSFTLEPTATPIPAATPTLPVPTFTPLPAPSSISMPTVVPTPLLTVTSWSTFTYNINPPQISVDYPSDWNVEVINNIPDPNHLFWAQFHPPGDSNQQGISVRVYRFEHVVDPRDGGWVKFLWPRPITIEGATGMMTLTSAPSQLDLSSFYYSEKHKLQINIFFSPPIYVDPTILQSSSITDTISQEYGVYEHMVESVRLIEPN